TAEGFPVSAKSQDVTPSGLLGFLALPDAPTPGGLLILPTIFGVHAFVGGYAETLARAGLAAAVWDHYDRLPLTIDTDDLKAGAGARGVQAQQHRNGTRGEEGDVRQCDGGAAQWRRLAAHVAQRSRLTIGRGGAQADQSRPQPRIVERKPTEAQPGTVRGRGQ